MKIREYQADQMLLVGMVGRRGGVDSTPPSKRIRVHFKTLIFWNSLPYLSRVFVDFLWQGGGGGVESTHLHKPMLQLSWDNKTLHTFVPAKKYPCANIGCHSSISDVTMTSSIFLRQRSGRFCIWFVNQVLFRYENVASILFDFLEC